MVDYAHCTGFTGFRGAFGHWNILSCCFSICLSNILMQKVYRNILVLLVGLCTLHLIFSGMVFLILSISILALSALSSKMAAVIDKYWMLFGEKLGAVNASILLFLVYYLLLTPIALIAKVFGRDLLRLKRPVGSNFNNGSHKFSKDDLDNPW